MKRSHIRILFAVLFTISVWTGRPAIGQETTRLNAWARQMVMLGVDESQALRMQSRFSERQMERAQKIVRDAVDQDVPVGPIVNKAMEGFAKNVGPGEIMEAMDQVRGRYAEAKRQSVQITPDRTRSRTMTQSLADCMAAGVPPEDVAEIAEQVRSRQRSMDRKDFEALAEKTFETARDMARLGVPAPGIKTVVSEALQNQYSAKQMEQVRSRFMNHAQSLDPETLSNRVQNQIRSGQLSEAGNSGKGGGPGGSGGGSGGSSGGSGGGSGGSGGSGGGSGSGGSGGGSGGHGGGGSGGGGGRGR